MPYGRYVRVRAGDKGHRPRRIEDGVDPEVYEKKPEVEVIEGLGIDSLPIDRLPDPYIMEVRGSQCR